MVINVNNIRWNTIGQFFGSHSALDEGKVLTLPLAGDFVSLYYRRDLFTAYGLTVPRTLVENVVTAQVFNNTDLNGDGEPDYGSCFPHAGEFADAVFFTWIAQVLQCRGTSQATLTRKPCRLCSRIVPSRKQSNSGRKWLVHPKRQAARRQAARRRWHMQFLLTQRCAMT